MLLLLSPYLIIIILVIVIIIISKKQTENIMKTKTNYEGKHGTALQDPNRRQQRFLITDTGVT